ncbi:TlpA disulfide reductase family protein [Mucilaginibacter paludis]|nr:TlpA disulfide reductase family protein [Mucilaginibacter paludis]
MRQLVLLLFSAATSMLGYAQQVKIITSNQLNSRFKKGEDTTYVVNFWATWCSPCIKELPSFEKLKKHNFIKPVRVILVSTDLRKKDLSYISAFVKKYHLTDDLYLLDEEPADYLSAISSKWTGSLPATLIIKPRKNNRAFYNRPLSYEELVSIIDAD